MANFNFNKVILGGRLTADPELKTTQSGIPVTRFSVAVNRRFTKQGEQPQTDFINCVAWRTQAEFITRYFRKGSSICVVGSIQTSTTTDPQGQKRYFTDVIVDEVNFVDSKSESPAGGSTYTPGSYQTPGFASDAGAPHFEEMANDDDLPF
ncbi:MAG: single-stranded DNA-binding protein [Clostridia bacterium]|nr:single-stranded DNA-binding protein [Clostridia bacterium]